jgi:hypothetical protein
MLIHPENHDSDTRCPFLHYRCRKSSRSPDCFSVDPPSNRDRRSVSSARCRQVSSAFSPAVQLRMLVGSPHHHQCDSAPLAIPSLRYSFVLCAPLHATSSRPAGTTQASPACADFIPPLASHCHFSPELRLPRAPAAEATASSVLYLPAFFSSGSPPSLAALLSHFKIWAKTDEG